MVLKLPGHLNQDVDKCAVFVDGLRIIVRTMLLLLTILQKSKDGLMLLYKQELHHVRYLCFYILYYHISSENQ